jgi:hypothetical protein
MKCLAIRNDQVITTFDAGIQAWICIEPVLFIQYVSGASIFVN